VVQYSPSTADPTTWRENIGCGPPGLHVAKGWAVIVTVDAAPVTVIVDAEAVTRSGVSEIFHYSRILC
jgi:hypothetical protein